MSGLRRLVLDVIKPQEPSIIDMAKVLSNREDVEGINISIKEIDRKVENVKITVQGVNINDKEIFELIEKFGAAIHSIDEVVAGKSMIEHVLTLEEM
ncbi:MAG: DUF211 domain-containing protein [Candidatus Altiarchaeota archaeon]|nr:DUF211 domain-containing protein [Candidatus Altiarchaeota archaeon]